MMELVKPTQIIRATVPQEATIILPPCADGAVHLRRVQLLVPGNVKVYATLDVEPTALGPNRTYKMPVMPSDTAIVFTLTNEQFLVAASDNGFAEVSLIVEHQR